MGKLACIQTQHTVFPEPPVRSSVCRRQSGTSRAGGGRLQCGHSPVRCQPAPRARSGVYGGGWAGSAALPAHTAPGVLAASVLECCARRRALRGRADAVSAAGRGATSGDAVVLSVEAPGGVALRHFVYTVGSRWKSAAMPGSVPTEFRRMLPELLDGVLASMREGEQRPVPSAGGDWLVHLEQVCTPRGWSLCNDPFSGARGAASDVASTKAGVLSQCGIVTLRGAEEGALSAEHVVLARAATLGFAARAIECIGEQLARDPSTVLRYSDVVARTSHRLNVKVDELWDRSHFSFLHAGSTFHEVLREAFQTNDFRLTHCGALLARPAPDGLPNNVNQAWHRDAPEEPHLSKTWDPFAAVVYIPLVDVYSDNGVTEFLVGSHRDGTDPSNMYMMESSEARMVNTAGLNAGDIVIFDCRTCHRGLLHTAPHRGLGSLGLRPVLALNFGVGAWEDKEDANNWGSCPLVMAP